MDDKTPVSPEEYNDHWLQSAWGDSTNQALLSGQPIALRPRIARAVELSTFQPHMSLLDIACGRGEFPLIASYQGVRATGIDFSGDVLSFANRVRQAHNSSLPESAPLNLVQSDASKLPFGDESFDRITMLDIIEHLTPEQLEAMFIEVKRVLKPKGYAIIHTLPNKWVYNFTFPLLHKLSKRFPKDPRGPIDRKIHINEQALPGLHKTLKKCGLRHRLWLEQHMASQARWNSGSDVYGDSRDNIYPILAGPAGRILELLSLTPLKLVLSNDIFGLLWKDSAPPASIERKLALTEKLVILGS